MSERQLLQGKLVRLTAYRSGEDSEAFARFFDRSDFLRLMDSDPARPHSARHFRAMFEKDELTNDCFNFAIRTLAEDRLIGGVELDEIEWPHGVGWIGIGIGDPAYWDRGYGTDAMREIIRFGFEELELHRLSLNVFEYNLRAMKVYEKLGFEYEGRVKEFLYRDGRRWDVVFMGLLRQEWKGG